MGKSAKLKTALVAGNTFAGHKFTSGHTKFFLALFLESVEKNYHHPQEYENKNGCSDEKEGVREIECGVRDVSSHIGSQMLSRLFLSGR